MKGIKVFRLLAVGSLLVTLFYACRKDVVEHRAVVTPNYYYSYFPLRTGNVSIYMVDSMPYKPLKGAFDTIHYFLKEVIDSPFIDNTGQTAYKVFRWTSKDTSLGWTAQRVWTTKLTKNEAQRWEENIRYTRLFFPVSLGYSWNGNEYNTIDIYKEFNYNYKEVHKPFSLAGLSYDSTCLVQEADYADFTERRIFSERYAAQVGLIYREEMDTANYSGNPGQLDQTSYYYKQTLIKYSR